MIDTLSPTAQIIALGLLSASPFAVGYAYTLGGRNEARRWARRVGGHTHQVAEGGVEHRCNTPRASSVEHALGVVAGPPWTCPICGLTWEPTGTGGWHSEGPRGVPVSFTMEYPDGDRTTFQIRPQEQR